MSNSAPSKQKIVIVTGMSGAGKSTALNAFEDIGYEAIDNVPLPLIEPLVGYESSNGVTPVVIGVDSRTRAFSVDTMAATVKSLRANKAVDLTVVFFECSNDRLVQRYKETRRRHPLAQDRPANDGIVMERKLLAPVRLLADSIFDTTTMSGRDTRVRIQDRYRIADRSGLRITVMSFGFANGIPRDADMVFDVRFLRNPHYDDDLRPKTGKDAGVAAYVRADPQFDEFTNRLDEMLNFMVDRHSADDRSYLTIAFGCTGGKHRSVMMAERTENLLRKRELHVSIEHRDIPKD